jgi:glycosyltransferase involved in cell wall biosynthesis
MTAVVMRVLLVCDRLDVAGGVERFVCTLANHLVSMGHSVALGTVDTPAGCVRYPLDARVKVCCAGVGRGSGDAVDGQVESCVQGPFDSRDRPSPFGRLRRLWKLASGAWDRGRALATVVRANPADVIVLNGLVTACVTLPWIGAQASRVVCCDHNHFLARSTVWQWMRRRLYPRVAAVVSLTEADAARFRALNPHTEVIANASSLHADAPPPDAGFVVLAVGRHVAQKGFDLLLDAWVQVLRELPEARLRVVGDGPLQPQLETQARRLRIGHSVEWCAPTTQVETFFRSASLFVLPSRYEGMPLALLEAQALGLPAVAFDCPTGPAEIIGEGSGIVVADFDVDALARAIVALLSDPVRRRAMGAVGIERSRRLFSPAQHVDRWTALLERVAARARVA